MTNKLNPEASPYLSNSSKVGWSFDNSYARLPKTLLSRLEPASVKKPKLLILNKELSKELGLNFSAIKKDKIASLFAGSCRPRGAKFIAQAYAGHQYGHFTMLGDGRALLMGEHLAPNNNRVDIQLKGSGRTPYSRNGDGKAALGPVLREYIISEAMHALGIPSTRSLAVVRTGENIVRETSLPGAILTRVATSHIRVGTFQYVAMQQDINLLKNFTNYTINRHYPTINDSSNPALSLLETVMKKQIELVISWMRIGFIHGVMNTDNMSVSGETIDYGPCAFMDIYNPETVFSSIDLHGRYSYGNQPSIVHWNVLRFAETLLPLIDKKQDKAIEAASILIDKFAEIYKNGWLKMMRKKIGLFGEDGGDETLINDLLSWMKKNGVDYTNTFCSLIEKDLSKNILFQDVVFQNWSSRWYARLKKNKKPLKLSFDLMQNNNPFIIPRNHKVEEVLSAAHKNSNLIPLYDFLEILKKPYTHKHHYNDSKIKIYQFPPTPNGVEYKTFCGT